MLHIRSWDFNIVNYCPKLIKLFQFETHVHLLLIYLLILLLLWALGISEA